MKLKELLFGGPNRIRHVIRFGTVARTRDENVAEHSFFTAFYALMIARELEWNYEKVGALLTRCLVHDMEEAESGDFPRPFKYSSPELRDALDVAGRKAFDLVFGSLGLSEQTLLLLKNQWAIAKDESDVGRLVSFCDFLSAAGYLLDEVRMSNASITKYCTTMKEQSKKFSATEYDFIRPYVRQAQAIVREAMQ